jgi:hypothetical protein
VVDRDGQGPVSTGWSRSSARQARCGVESEHGEAGTAWGGAVAHQGEHGYSTRRQREVVDPASANPTAGSSRCSTSLRCRRAPGLILNPFYLKFALTCFFLLFRSETCGRAGGIEGVAVATGDRDISE